ncbi:uncharacterized protein LOC125769475 [Anopheles funestus]|uniref:uncharacterized protein LOC125769475 n=1 Tax=Anopheles funestus TaxID=62324 RepID=UPI0020C6271F|nr:uncharacterized protein LOC125769475 [Anopheles funestus]
MICTIDTVNVCRYRQKSEKFDPGNFIRHIRTAHPTLATAHGLQQEDSSAPGKQTKIMKVPVALDQQKLLEGIIKLVCLHNVPMMCVEWEGFKIILQPICDALKVQLNRKNLVCHLGAAVEKIRSAIFSAVQGNLLCLKIDSATRLGRHILGVNIQFYDTEQEDIVIYTIGNVSSMVITFPKMFLQSEKYRMIELNQRHTGKYLKSKILEILGMYQVTLDQIFAVTCDNGANMIATVKQMQSDLENSFSLPTDEDDHTDTTEQLDWMSSLEKEFSSTITLVRCAVHTLQLSVADVVKKFDTEIRKCTAVSNNCRKIAYKAIFNEESLSPLYSKTRWGGIFEMLKHFCDHEDLFTDLGQQYPELGKIF